MRRTLLALTVAFASAAGCSAGSTPTLPSAPASASSTAQSTSPPPPRRGCSDKNQTRIESYAPGSPLPPGDTTGKTVAAIKSKGKLTVGVSADNLLFGFRNPISGRLEGFDIDVVSAIAKAIFGTNIAGKIEYRVENFAQRIPDLRAGRVDLVADIMTINCSRWSQIAFSTEYFHAGQQVLVRKGSSYKRIEDLNGKKVCTANGSTGSQNLENIYPDVVRALVDNISDCMVLFQQGAVAGIVSDNTVLNGFASQDPYAEVVGKQFTNEPYGLGIPARNVDFVQFVNALLQKWRVDGTWMSLYEKWLPGSAPSPPPAVYGRVLP
jgi:polar amino acid transport system substrate-binding protein